jgi:hypothetical protein
VTSDLFDFDRDAPREDTGMLLFLNIDCVLDVPSDAAGPASDGAGGIRRLEAVLERWPSCRVVVTSERRYRMTLAHFRGFFSPPMRHRLVGTTLLYDPRSAVPPRTRGDEIADYLAHGLRAGAGWVALDRRADGFSHARDRLVCCESFTAHAAAQLHLALLHRHAACTPTLCAA